MLARCLSTTFVAPASLFQTILLSRCSDSFAMPSLHLVDSSQMLGTVTSVSCGSGRIEHFLVCEGIALFRARTFLYGCVPWDLLFVLPSSDKELIGGAVLIDCILYALRARRVDAHGAHAVQIMNARYKHLRVRHRSLEEGLKAVVTV